MWGEDRTCTEHLDTLVETYLTTTQRYHWALTWRPAGHAQCAEQDLGKSRSSVERPLLVLHSQVEGTWPASISLLFLKKKKNSEQVAKQQFAVRTISSSLLTPPLTLSSPNKSNRPSRALLDRSDS